MTRRGGRAAADYTVCPTCGRRTVLFHFGRNGGDYLRCTRDSRGCTFETFRDPESWDTRGRADVAAWQAANPTAEDR